MSKWILETNEANCAEYRVPNPGEHYLGMTGLTVYKAPESPRITAQCVILHPECGTRHQGIRGVAMTSDELLGIDRGDGSPFSVTYEGSHYECVADAIAIGILGMCGCGRPQDALLFVLAGLELSAEKRPDGYDEHRAWWSDWDVRCKAFFGSSGGAYFFWYAMTDKGIMEHGGSVPGWLSGKGKLLVAALREIKPELESES
jgi:hypothetical protein